MNIRPSAAIRKNYNEISTLCRDTGEPVYLTKNGVGDLVVMGITAFPWNSALQSIQLVGRIGTEGSIVEGVSGFVVKRPRALLPRDREFCCSRFTSRRKGYPLRPLPSRAGKLR